MCLYPRIIKNPKYKANKKNGGIIPPVIDKRTLYVPIGCQKCSECRKQRANGWKTRLTEEIKYDKNGTFTTLTLTDTAIIEIREIIIKENENAKGYTLENLIAKKALERFRERWRKETGQSPKHWIITELGSKNTERIHLHGIIWSNENKKIRDERIKRLWQYGNTYEGTYMNERTGAYITKYMLKTDILHKEYTPEILTSPGIGKTYIETERAKYSKYKGEETKTYYINGDGTKGSLPIYYRNKIYTEEQRQTLWIKRLDENIRYVKGEKINIDTEQGYKTYEQVREWHREKDKRLGYGTDEKDWNRIEYEKKRREILMDKRIEKLKQWEELINEDTGEITRQWSNKRLQYG